MTPGRIFIQNAMTPATRDDKIAAAVYPLGFVAYNGVVDMLKFRANTNTGYIKIGNRFYTYDSTKVSPSTLESVLGPLQQGKTDYSSLADSVLAEPTKSQADELLLQRRLAQRVKGNGFIDPVGTKQEWAGKIPGIRIDEILRDFGAQDDSRFSGGGPGAGAGLPARFGSVPTPIAPSPPTQLDALHQSMQRATPPTDQQELLKMLLRRYWGEGAGY